MYGNVNRNLYQGGHLSAGYFLGLFSLSVGEGDWGQQISSEMAVLDELSKLMFVSVQKPNQK